MFTLRVNGFIKYISQKKNFYSYCQIIVIDVIHTVGPKGEIPEELQSAYQNSLDLAVEKKLRTIVSIKM